MKKNALILLVIVSTLFTACSNDDDSESGPLESTSYTLQSVDNSGVQGTVTISENEDGSSTVSIELNGSTTDEHPAFIYHGNATQDSEIAITLNACTCDTSVTQITQLDSGAKISYDGLKAFNGHVKIHMSADDLETVVATANIGVNAN